MSNQETGMVFHQERSETLAKASELAKRLKYMIVNGSKLSDNEVYALAQYAAANELNPFAGECYYLPGVGPVPGVAGWRSKAQNQLDFEAKLANQSGGNFWFEYEHAKPEDCCFDPSKDIAYKAILHDSVTRQRWFDAIASFSMNLIKSGITVEEAFKFSRETVGKEPVTESWGVVFSSESFAKEGKPEKFDRHERAKKRAEKLCLRKRFPRIHLPEPEGVDDVIDSEDYRVVMGDEEEESQKPTRTLTENLEQLGFPQEKEKEEQPPAPTEQRPYTPSQLHDRLKVMADSLAGQTCTDGQRKSVRINLSTLAGGEANYPQYLEYLTGFTSSNDMPDNWVLAVAKWIGSHKDVDGQWVISEMALKEGQSVFGELFG